MIPEIIIASFSLLLLLLQAFNKKIKYIFPYAAIVSLLAALVFTLISPVIPQAQFEGVWRFDNMSRFFDLIFIIGSLLVILLSVRYAKEEHIDHGEYYALILLATAGMMVMASAVDFILIFLGLELLSISLYALAGVTRGRSISSESSFKYFILGAFATAFLLYGMSLIYGATGSTNIEVIATILGPNTEGNVMLHAGILFLIVGFGFKTALVPFHMWTPDVYEGAPSVVTAFMASGPKAASFAAFLRILITAFPEESQLWGSVLWILAALTMTAGNLMALVQTNVKRMLAYSSIAHAGYVLVAFLASKEESIRSVAFYMLAYTFMSTGAFAIISMLAEKGERFLHVDDFKGLAFKRPVLAGLLSLFLFSLAGMPPTGGFTAKFLVFSSAVHSGFIYLTIIGVLNSALSVYVYLKLTVAMYMKEEGRIYQMEAVPYTDRFALILSATGIGAMGIFPSAFLSILNLT